MSKRHTDSTSDENPRKRRKLSAGEVLVEAARKGDTTAVRAGLEKFTSDIDSKTVAFDAVHEACRGNHDECLALLLAYVETTQMGFGILLSECVHADHTACTEVLLQHWKSVCSNVAHVPLESEDSKGHTSGLCPAMWSDPAVCQVLIDAGTDIETKDVEGRSPLHFACSSGSLDVVKMLVKAGAGVGIPDSMGQTCLTIAAHNRRTETVHYLVGVEGVEVDHTDINGGTALLRAASLPFADVVQVLIDAGADIEAKDKNGYSPLLFACVIGALDVVKKLVASGAGVRVTNDSGATCLAIAASHGRTETVRYLVDLPEVEVDHTDDEGRTALHLSTLHKRTDVVPVLIDAGADIEARCNNNRFSPLLYATVVGELEIFKLLVRSGAGVCVTCNDGMTCLELATGGGKTEIVSFILSLPEVDVNDAAGRNALRAAVRNNHADVVQAFIDAGADVNGTNTASSLLIGACSEGDLVMVKKLVEAGAGVCARDDKGNACLIVASSAGHTETVRYLVGLNHMDVDHVNNDGNTALHLAVRNNHADVVKLLVGAGAGVGIPDSTGNTSLMYAAYHGHAETVRYLVGVEGVEVDKSHSMRGYTALHLAVQQKHADVVQVFIDAGAEVEAKDGSGSTPLHVASSSGSLDLVKLLVEAGTGVGIPAGVRVTDKEGDTCLTLAASRGHTETVRYLVDFPEVEVDHADISGYTALLRAAALPFADVVQVLIDAGADIEAKDKKGYSALLFASVGGELDVVKKLIASGAGVRVTNDEGATCLAIAASHGRTETVRYLVDLPKVEVDHANDEGHTALHLSTLHKRADVVPVLIDAGADIEARCNKGYSPLLYATAVGELEIFKLLVRSGAGVCVTSNDGMTCLALAPIGGQSEFVSFILSLPEVDVNDADGRIALRAAVRNNHADVVQAFIDAGADVNGTNTASSLLIGACSEGDLVMVKKLVEAGAGVCARDDEGNTCLHFASSAGHTETVRYLVGLNHMDVEHVNNVGNTALHLAVRNNHADVVKILREHGVA